MRIAFILSPSSDWLGGVSYFLNLFRAIAAADPSVRLVVLTPAGGDDAQLAVLRPWCEIVTVPWMRPKTAGWLAWKADCVLRGRDVRLGRLLCELRIDVLSHVILRYAPDGGVPVLGWIPDFQHRHLPHLFPAGERQRRDVVFARCLATSKKIIFSSRNAAEDGDRFLGCGIGRSAVLTFSSWLEPGPLPDGLPSRYFHIPNQFYIHKDHRTLVEALGILQSRGQCVDVVATGNPRDLHDPHHVQRLRERAAELGVAERFHIRGIVPRPDLASIMSGSVAVVNTSKFEGWSTSVEEARSMGKRTILSDIPVHREQSPPGCNFFQVGDSAALADILSSVFTAFDPAIDRGIMAVAEGNLPARKADFGRRYLNLVKEVCA